MKGFRFYFNKKDMVKFETIMSNLPVSVPKQVGFAVRKMKNEKYQKYDKMFLTTKTFYWRYFS